MAECNKRKQFLMHLDCDVKKKTNKKTMQRCVTLNVHIVDMKDCGKKYRNFNVGKVIIVITLWPFDFLA